ncbi:alkanesulfonate monooxygenase SsuD/methylene tetrahydromethanopterin reductase-like flavin-dependent oxidoreductase (luciferase family) [Nocardioides daedukensis]|uniref:Alkanesulfonate monooxygenase SsuD/methylene tetrahydromethanopterin reductase-like flavin-dependent oxidoreductase (Luciferase family) n=1 Tax=Nocardioides daedukensis TaxID=634462 RepID=A0A7Y9RVD9_9ACTN|nr:LLM class flavin-dependent oxidoreductase [Nocardioides daedukensis]NYG57322.1 alkanesulfonate monooxygenase SsuD/methylene tetrahydromethanopterin reductase-like flavin-dependent oxidoreductase (luciferase family) [Nocardioides daedukensis]
MARTHFVVRYDFRMTGTDRSQRQELYARALEQAAYADQRGHDALVLSEHHGAEDGYLPSPVPVAAAMAAVTSRIRISIAALLVNLHEPLRLAEDLAVLDHLSGGRVSHTIGLGYRREEYALFGRPWSTRGADLEARIRVLLDAWSGEEFSHEGRRVRVSPTPFTQPHPILFLGGGSLAAAHRAARLGLHFQPQRHDRDLRAAYQDECRAQGREPGLVVMPGRGPATIFCAEDPDEFWARHGEHLLADAAAYRAWQGAVPSAVADGSTTVDEMRAAGVYAVFTPDDLEARCRSGEIAVVTSHPGCGGLPAEPSWESLRLVSDVLERLRS